MDNLIDPSFQGVNEFFASLSEDNKVRTGQAEHSLQKGEIKDTNIMIEEKNFFDQPIRNDINHMKLLEKLLLVKEVIAFLFLRKL